MNCFIYLRLNKLVILSVSIEIFISNSMNRFDAKAQDWDKNNVHLERTKAIAKQLLSRVDIQPHMRALEFGAGTGLLSFELQQKFSSICMMDNSAEMVKVMHQKVEQASAKNLQPEFFDLEHNTYNDKPFDFIFTQMVMHHVVDVEKMFAKFYALLNSGGYLAIADLYSEDGSFHGPDVKVHLGFDPENLAKSLKQIGFTNVSIKHCFDYNKTTIENSSKTFPIFLLIAQKG